MVSKNYINIKNSIKINNNNNNNNNYYYYYNNNNPMEEMSEEFEF